MSTPAVITPIIGRQLTLKILRGLEAQLPKALPLSWGEFYFGEDTGNLFIGTPGVGLGYIVVGDTREVNQTLLLIYAELQAMRKALVQLATDGARADPRDFEPVVNDPVKTGEP